MYRHPVNPQQKRGGGRPRYQYRIPASTPRPPGYNPKKSVPAPQNASSNAASEQSDAKVIEQLKVLKYDLTGLDLASKAYHADVAASLKLHTASKKKRSPHYIARTKRDVSGERTLVAVVPTSEAPEYMDHMVRSISSTRCYDDGLIPHLQPQDLLMKRVTVGSAVEQKWQGPGLDAPKDIRCRRFHLVFKDNFPQSEQDGVRTNPQLVYRAEYHCAGAHNKVFDGDDESRAEAEHVDEDDEIVDMNYAGETARDDSEEEQEEERDKQEEEKEEEEEEEKEDSAKRRSRCTGDPKTCVQYHVRASLCFILSSESLPIRCNMGQFEISSNDLNKMIVWRIGDHPDAMPCQLGTSRFQRHEVLARIKSTGATAISIYRGVCLQGLGLSRFILTDCALTELVVPYTGQSPQPPFQEHRRLKELQVLNMFANCQHRDQLHVNSFRAVDMVVEQNEGNTFL